MYKRKLCLLTLVMCSVLQLQAYAATVVTCESGYTLYSNPSAPYNCGVLKVLTGGSTNGDEVKVNKKDISTITGALPLDEVGQIISSSTWYAVNFGIGTCKPYSGMKIIESPTSYTVEFSEGVVASLEGSEKAYEDLYLKMKDLCDNVLGIKTGDDSVEAITKVYDWMSSNFTYDYDARNSTLNTVFETKKTTCWQIAKLFDMACDYIGVECVSAESMDGTHMMNVVTIDGQKLYVDVTAGIGGHGHTYLLTPQYDLFGGPKI